jgi:signal transduction histidine kinase
MDYRANLIGGRLHVQNLSQGGVRVACRFPQK